MLFHHRIGDLINLRGEKMSEDCLRQALFDTVTSWEAVVIDYSCAECHLVEAVKGSRFSSDENINFKSYSFLLTCHKHLSDFF